MSTGKQESDNSQIFIRLFRAVVVLALGIFLGLVVWQNATHGDAKHPFKLGLDLAGGSHLIYEADVTNIDPKEVPALMDTLRTVIEQRINAFGVAEPVVQVEKSSFVSGDVKHRLVIELPGVTDVDKAIAEIGRTPLLEFKLIDQAALSAQQSLKDLKVSASTSSSTISVTPANTTDIKDTDIYNPYVDTGLTGRYLESAALEFTNGQGGQLAGEPIVSIRFTAEGAKLFEDITRNNTGEFLAIFLDGEQISAPRINEPISGGTAVISGGFSPEEAKALAQNLNLGALPVPIKLDSTQTIDATLGSAVVDQSLIAGVIGLTIISLFMIFWYRLPGLVAAIALVYYLILSCIFFMYIPVTLTAAGLAGLILSLGMAVDANVLVFERLKEEFRAGKSSRTAAKEGFVRAWSAIRDGNVTGLLSAVVLFWFGTAMIKGFALVLGIGIIISMFTALTLTRTLLIVLPDVEKKNGGIWAFLFGTGLRK